MNVVYYEMTQRLSYDQSKEGAAEAARKQLDAEMKIKRWRVAVVQEDPYAGQVEDEGAPWWWDGDQEASDSFLKGMGVDLNG